MKRSTMDLSAGIGVLALAVFLYFESTRIKSLDVSRFGSGFFPAIVAGLLAILGLVIAIGAIRDARAAKLAPPVAAKAKAEEGKRPLGVLATFVLMAAFAGLLPILGFLITTTLYLFLQILVLSPKDKRRYLLFAVISVVTSVAVYYAFVKLFQLMLPAGILG